MTDDLETVYELRIKGRKADLVELFSVIHTGGHVQHKQGNLAPPDAEMVNDLLTQLNECLEPDQAAAALQRRLETGDLVVGEKLECSLEPTEES